MGTGQGEEGPTGREEIYVDMAGGDSEWCYTCPPSENSYDSPRSSPLYFPKN